MLASWTVAASDKRLADTHEPDGRRNVRLFTDHADAKRVEREENRRLTPEARLRIGAELHAFWVRHHHPDASRLDRTLRVVQRARS